jgi:hypothetical protein
LSKWIQQWCKHVVSGVSHRDKRRLKRELSGYGGSCFDFISSLILLLNRRAEGSPCHRTAGLMRFSVKRRTDKQLSFRDTQVSCYDYIFTQAVLRNLTF